MRSLAVSTTIPTSFDSGSTSAKDHRSICRSRSRRSVGTELTVDNRSAARCTSATTLTSGSRLEQEPQALTEQRMVIGNHGANPDASYLRPVGSWIFEMCPGSLCVDDSHFSSSSATREAMDHGGAVIAKPTPSSPMVMRMALPISTVRITAARASACRTVLRMPSSRSRICCRLPTICAKSSLEVDESTLRVPGRG